MKRIGLMLCVNAGLWAQGMPAIGSVSASTGAGGGGGGSNCTPAAGYAHCRVLTIDHTQAGGSTLTNFPVLVTGTLGSSRVQNSNCYDVIFTSDSAGAAMVPWEMVSCTQSSGAVTEAWALAASVSPTTDTTLYASYGNASISAAQNTGANAPANVWAGSYSGVWHMGSPATFSGVDSTTNANNGTATSVSAASGLIGGAGSFTNASNSQVDVGNSASLQPSSQITVSAWVKGSSPNGAYDTIYGTAQPIAPYGAFIREEQTGVVLRSAVPVAGIYTPAGAGFTFDTAWHYLVLTYDGSTETLYKDGSSFASASGSGAISSVTAHTLLGADPSTSGRSWDGLIDEVHLLSVAKASGWVTAEYNNQKPGSTFITFGGER